MGEELYNNLLTSITTSGTSITLTGKQIGTLLDGNQTNIYMDFKPLKAIGVKKVIFNRPATIVIWTDGSKTVVKCHNEAFDKEKGLAMCITKKVLGEKFHQTFREWCGEDV